MRKESFNLLFPFLFFLITGICSSDLNAQDPVFTATVASYKVVQNTIFEIRFELKNASGSNFQAPSFDNFKVISGPSISSSTMIMNGEVSRSESWNYTLLAEHDGKFIIEPAKVAAGRKLLTTRSVNIEVLKSKGTSGPGITTTGKEKILLIADIDSSSYYPGQQIILRYKLLFNVNIQSITAVSEDDYSDFFIRNFSNNNRPSSMENINGIPYTSRVIKTVALFAHQSGTYTIDPFILDAGIEAPFPEKRGFFSMRNLEMVKIASTPKVIHILPLPPDAPPNFSGAVGKYSVKVNAGPSDITTDDAFTLSLDVVGDGDSKRWDPPAPVADGDFEIYDPRIVEDKMAEETDHIAHHRTIEYQMIAPKPGKYKVVIPLIYFNPQTRKYESASSDTFHLNVTQGFKKQKGSAILEVPEVPLPLRPVRNITTDDRFWLSMPHLFLFGLLLTGSFWGMFVSYKRRQEDLVPAREKNRIAAVRHARLQLDTLQSTSTNLSEKEYFEWATEIFYKFLSDKLSIPPAELDQEKLEYYLDKGSVPEPVKSNVIHFFVQCLSVRYGAIPGNKSREEMISEIRNFIDLV
ncbi:MAG: BatD family protein [Saprospiraceae bacterium]